jgi:hypothetical protein
MPDVKFSQLNQLQVTAVDDYLPIIDSSDTTMGVNGTNKKISIANLTTGINTGLAAGYIRSDVGFIGLGGNSAAYFPYGARIATTVSLEGLVTEGVSQRGGAGAIPLTHPVCKLISTDSAQAITLADGANGQRLTIYHGVDSGSMVLTATTKTGWTTSITFTDLGDNVVLQYFDTVGWLVLSSRGATVS